MCLFLTETLQLKVTSQKMQQRLKLAYAAVFHGVDFILSTILYGHGSEFKYYLVTDIRFFKFDESFLEFWVFSCLRFILAIGAIIGIWKNTKHAVYRIEWSQLIIFAMSAFMWSYAIVKLLLYSETGALWDKDVWFWCFFAWTIIASILLYLHWSQLFVTLKPAAIDSERSKVAGRSNVNHNDGDVERLIESEENDSTSITYDQSFLTIFRSLCCM